MKQQDGLKTYGYCAALAICLVSTGVLAEPGLEVAHETDVLSTDVATQNFTGKVTVTAPFKTVSPSNVSGALVTFSPGARTNWHTHPLGQTLIITSGTGWVQAEGEPRREVVPGDVVTISPETRHWHGATDAESMAHLAIAQSEQGVRVQWQEPVSDAIYTDQ